jgi:hypothetical protein
MSVAGAFGGLATVVDVFDKHVASQIDGAFPGAHGADSGDQSVLRILPALFDA